MALSRSKAFLLILLGIVLLLGIWTWTTYNGLVRAKAALDTSWAQVETQYQRRFDLIPNLQATVQGAADFEQETFTAVTAARTQWQSAETRTEKVAAVNGFESALSRLLVTVEAYPTLKATEAFRDFMTQLEGTENRIAVARRDYNEEVRTFNVYTTIFPRNVLAGMFGYEPAAFFASDEAAADAPNVQF
ncbi:MAG: LemA family protein [Candidatus Peribacteraceae bacterium]|nr:LemA family protein [Candidatus Peribacteraceae bacterium]